MELTFDPRKDSINRTKHGISLAEAEKIEWETLWATKDDRQDYGEMRIIGFAYIGPRLHCVVYTDRGETRRIISLRKANPREMRHYAAT